MAETRDGTRTAPAGSVADEAALLVDLLSSRGWGVKAPEQSARSERSDESEQSDHSHHTDRPADGSAQGSDETGSSDERGECSCGGTTPAACRICPVCQLISFVQRLSPDSLERVADVVELAATGLRDLAHAQRGRQPEDSPPPDAATEGTHPG
ncbi:hypothetical protein [Intrasporangium sp.]|uniref:hypothetical protein n=1 Tax=Intrasporangium sp. TaxID=1925024 RepID=UPI00336570B5